MPSRVASAVMASVLRVKPKRVSVMSRAKCLAILWLSSTAPTEPDFGLAAQRLAFAGDGGSDAGEIALSGGKQILALARALGGERAVAADDQALAGEIG